jgi:hypothetical protein
MSDPTQYKVGDLTVSAEGVAVIKVTPEEIQRYIKFRDGVEKAITCVETLKAEDIKRAGLNPVTVQETVELIAEYRHMCELHPVAERLTEMLYDTKMNRAHRISLNFGELASQGRRRGERDPNGAEILGPLMDLLDYQFGPGKKGASTRAKLRAKAEGEQADEADEADEPSEPVKPVTGTLPGGNIKPIGKEPDKA